MNIHEPRFYNLPAIGDTFVLEVHLPNTPTTGWRKLAMGAAKENKHRWVDRIAPQLGDSLDRSDEFVTFAEPQKARDEVVNVE